jgi:tRNA (guanine37-N1)-methyltransferase
VTFNFITLFPELIKGYFGDSILRKALDDGKIEVNFINPRDFTKDRHRRVDLAQVGGGAGMLMMSQPILDSLASVGESHIVAVTPSGKTFRQSDAERLAKKESLTIISGRYEGFDERVVEERVDELFSIGDFILTGGELPSLIICDAVSRNIGGVLGNSSSLEGESFSKNLLESPNFAKPVNGVPSEYLNGNHAKIEALRFEMSKRKTQFFRPDLYQKFLTSGENL